MESSLVNKLGVNSSRFDTPHHTKRALFVQVPENPTNRNAPFLLSSFYVALYGIDIDALKAAGLGQC